MWFAASRGFSLSTTPPPYALSVDRPLLLAGGVRWRSTSDVKAAAARYEANAFAVNLSECLLHHICGVIGLWWGMIQTE